jgi:cytochrome P450
LAFLQHHQSEAGDTYSFKVATRKLNFINHPELVQRVLQENNRNYRKSIAYQKLGLLLGHGLLTSEGDFWRRQRRLSQPLFHKAEIQEYARMMESTTDRMIERIRDKKEVELNVLMTHLTLEIITETLLGMKLEEGGKVIEKYLPPLLQQMIKRIVSAINVPLWVPTKTNRQFKQSIQMLDQLISGLILEKEKEGKQKDLLSALMQARDEDNQGMTRQQLQDEIMTFFMAGHETTAVASAWAFYIIHSRPEIEQKIREELEEGDNTYLKAFIQEVLRYYSPIWVLGRESIEADEIGRYEISNKESIIFSPYMIHRHPEFWEDPDEFRPERFMDAKPVHKFAYFPFGGGPRLCIGNHFALMELEIIISRFLRAFKMKLDDTSFPGYDYSLTLRPGRTLNFAIKPLI